MERSLDDSVDTSQSNGKDITRKPRYDLLKLRQRAEENRKREAAAAAERDGDSNRTPMGRKPFPRDLALTRQHSKDSIDSRPDSDSEPRGRVFSNAEMPHNDNTAEFDDEMNETESNDYSEDIGSVTTVDLPPQLFPLSIIPHSRQSEKSANPLLAFPAAYPHILTDLTCGVGFDFDQMAFTRTQTSFSNVRTERTTIFEKDHNKFTAAIFETDNDTLINTNALPELVGLLDDAQNPDSSSTFDNDINDRAELNEAEEYLRMRRATVIAKSGTYSREVLHNALHAGVELTSVSKQKEGFYVGHAGVLAHVQLRDEPLALYSPHRDDAHSMERMIATDVSLSRVTQRLLRDLYASKKEASLRRIAFQSARNAGLSSAYAPANLLKPVDRDSSGGSESGRSGIRGKSAPKDDISFRSKEIKQNVEAHIQSPMLAHSHLIRNVEKFGPVLRVVEDLIESGNLSQPVIPETSVSFGGEIGQWGNYASASDKLGSITFTAKRGEIARSILRVDVRRITLSDHPLFLDEERKSMELKSLFAQYRVLYEHGATAYLTYRLHAVIEELERLSNITPEELEEEELQAMTFLYHDLLETLPSLCELKNTVHNLTASIYDLWRELKKIRMDQNFRATRAQLTVIKLQHGNNDDAKTDRDKQTKNKFRRGNMNNESERDEHRADSSDEADDDDSAPSAKSPLVTARQKSAMRSPKDRQRDHEILDQLSTEQREWEHIRLNLLPTLPDLITRINRIFRASDEIAHLMRSSTREKPGTTEGEIPKNNEEQEEHSERGNIELGGDAGGSPGKETMGENAVDKGNFFTKADGKQADKDKFNRTLKLVKECIRDLGGIFVSSGAEHSNPAVVGGRSSRGLLPDVLLRLSDSLSVTPDTHPGEVIRRLQFTETKFSVSLRVNGNLLPGSLGRSERCPMIFPGGYIDVNRVFELQLLHAPSSISLEVFMCHNGDSPLPSLIPPTDYHIASIAIPLPGSASSFSPNSTPSGMKGGALNNHLPPVLAFTPTFGVYSFSSSSVWGAVPGMISGVVLRLLGEGLVLMPKELEANPSVAKWISKILLGLRPSPVQGHCSCRTEYDVGVLSSANDAKDGQKGVYDGIKHDEIAHLPPPVMDSTGWGRSNRNKDFAKEKDFLGLLPDLSELDMNDPRNEHLVGMILAAGGLMRGHVSSGMKIANRIKDYFRLRSGELSTIHDEEGVSYFNYLRYQQPLRSKLLRIRVQKSYLFPEPIPLSEMAIRKSELYRLMLKGEESGRRHDIDELLREKSRRQSHFPDSEDADGDISHIEVSNRASNKVKSFVNRTRDSQVSSSRVTKKYFTTQAVVSEYESTSSFSCWEFFNFYWAVPPGVRRLRPAPKKRIPIAMQVRNCDILVQIVSAKNVPLRAEHNPDIRTSGPHMSTKELSNSQTFSGTGSLREDTRKPIVNTDLLDTAKLLDLARVRSFVEVHFQEGSVRTTTVEGISPKWDQILSLPFRAPQDDYSPGNLEQVTDEVFFNLFDEVILDDSSLGGHLEGESTERIEKRYLGSFSVPFSTIYTEGRIEGIFRLRTPPIHYGYNRKATTLVSKKGDTGKFFVDNEADPDQDMLALNETNSIFNCFGYFNASRSEQEIELMASVANSGLHITTAVENEFSVYASGSNATFVKVMITLDPLLNQHGSYLDVAKNDFSTSALSVHDKPISSYAQRWINDVRRYASYTRKRNYSLFGCDSNGMNVFICRFLSAMKPPMEITSPRGCVHLVKQLPFIKDSLAFGGALDVWCTASQVWDIIAGDEEEHAILLFNYLSYCIAVANKGKSDDSDDVFLALGRAVPEGNSVYVMIRERAFVSSGTSHKSETDARNYLVINPCDGFVYSAADPNCPLREIACLATANNIWANLQRNASPYASYFDLKNSSNWRAFFGARFPPSVGALATIQQEVVYSPTSLAYGMEIEQSIVTAVKNNVRRWRSRRKRSTTTFHPDASSILYDLMPTLDNHLLGSNSVDFNSSSQRRATQDSMNDDADAGSDADVDSLDRTGGTAGGGRGRGTNRQNRQAGRTRNAISSSHEQSLEAFEAEVNERLKPILRNRALHGCPVNVPYTDVDAICELIKTSSTHEARHPDVQFVLAVRAIPYVNNLVSLWIFFGTLEPAS